MYSGIFSKTFATASVEENFALIKQCGFQATQFNYASAGLPSLPDAIPENILDEINAARVKHQIKMEAISATFNLTHPDAAVIARGMASLETIAASAARLHCPLLTLCSGTLDADDQWRAHPENNSPAAWRTLLRSMEQALAIADQYQVNLGIEPELANIVNSAARARQLIDELQHPRLKIIFDPANLFEQADAAQQQRVMGEALDLLAPAIAIAHAKDRDARGEFVTAGHGVLDYPWYINALHTAGFDGCVVTHGLPADDAAGVSALLARLIPQAGGVHA